MSARVAARRGFGLGAALALAGARAGAQEATPSAEAPPAAVTIEVGDLPAGEVPEPPPVEAERERAPEAAPASEAAAPTEITIQGTPLSRIPGSAHVIRRRDMERTEYDDPHALLLTVPGVYARGEDGFGLRPNLGIRGALSDRSKKITLMEDGVLFAPAPYSAPAAYYFPLVTRMTQVRVIKGPAAIAYGPHTVAGAVDLVTRAIPSEAGGRLDVAVGEHAYGKFHGYAGASDERLGFVLEGAHVRSHGFKQLPGGEDTGFFRNEWMVKASYALDPRSSTPNEIGVKLSYSDELSNETYLGLSDADFERDPLRRYGTSKLDQMRWHRTGFALTHRVVPAPSFEITTTVYRNDFSRAWRKVNRFLGTDVASVLAKPEDARNAQFYAVLTGQADTSNPSETLMIGPNQRDFVAQGVETRVRWEGSTGAVAHRLEYGLRLHYDRVERRHSEDGFLVIGGELIPTGGATLVTAENEASAEAVAFHSAYTLGYGALSVSPGVRAELIRSRFVDRQRAAEARNSLGVVLPGLGAHFGLTRSLGLIAGVYRGFSPPPPAEPVDPARPNADDVSDPEPELAVNAEAGARFVDGDARAELIGFYNAYSNLTNICTFSGGCTDDSIDRQSSAGRARIYGLEAHAARDVPLGAVKLPIAVSYTLTLTEFLESFASQDPIFGEVLRGDEMPYVPRHQANASVGVEGGRAGGYVSASYVAAMREQAGSEPLDQTVATDEQLTVDLGGKLEIVDSLELYANVRNVFDAHYIVSRRPYGARPNAPRMAQIGAKLEF